MKIVEPPQWEVIYSDEAQEWMIRASQDDLDLVKAAAKKLGKDGPKLGRPTVDRVHSSKFHNMKEIRALSTGKKSIRALFIFDPKRRAFIILIGDKAGNWNKWYTKNVPIADAVYEKYLNQTEKESKEDTK